MSSKGRVLTNLITNPSPKSWNKKYMISLLCILLFVCISLRIILLYKKVVPRVRVGIMYNPAWNWNSVLGKVYLVIPLDIHWISTCSAPLGLHGLGTCEYLPKVTSLLGQAWCGGVWAGDQGRITFVLPPNSLQPSQTNTMEGSNIILRFECFLRVWGYQHTYTSEGREVRKWK